MVVMQSLISGPALLFAPAHRPELLAKAAERADMVIVDLEDGAGEGNREKAREVVRNSGLDPLRTIVRVIGPDHAGFAGDVAAVREAGFRNVMVPKLTDRVPGELAGLQVIAMVETLPAVLNLSALANHGDVVGLFWGAEDLTAQLGGSSSRYRADESEPGSYRDPLRWVRSRVLLHAAAAGKFAIDAVHADFRDLAGQHAEALDAARIGFAGTACIHPGQVGVVRKAYLPEQSQVEWARKVLAGAQRHDGAYQVDGEMIDAPIINQARRVLARLSEGGAAGSGE